jgi:hypothetical protein
VSIVAAFDRSAHKRPAICCTHASDADANAIGKTTIAVVALTAPAHAATWRTTQPAADVAADRGRRRCRLHKASTHTRTRECPPPARLRVRMLGGRLN